MLVLLILMSVLFLTADPSFSSVEEVWVTVLNITGPLSNWSFADNKLSGQFRDTLYCILCPFSFLTLIVVLYIIGTAPEKLAGGPPSYICRLSGASDENWTFWLEVQTTTPYIIVFNFILYSLTSLFLIEKLSL